MCIFVILLLCTSFPCVYSLSSVCLAACFGEIKMFITATDDDRPQTAAESSGDGEMMSHCLTPDITHSGLQ